MYEVLGAADMNAEAHFTFTLLDIPAVHRSDDWTTLQGRDVRLAVQLAQDHVPPHWPTHRVHSSFTSTSRSTTSTGRNGRSWRSPLVVCPIRPTPRTSACTATPPGNPSA